MRLGPILKRWRDADEREQISVAREIGITPSTLHRLESGRGVSSRTLARVLAWLTSTEALAKPKRKRQPELPLTNGHDAAPAAVEDGGGR